jgi:hypothetical protein
MTDTPRLPAPASALRLLDLWFEQHETLTRANYAGLISQRVYDDAMAAEPHEPPIERHPDMNRRQALLDLLQGWDDPDQEQAPRQRPPAEPHEPQGLDVETLLALLGPSHPHDEGRDCGTCKAYNLLIRLRDEATSEYHEHVAGDRHEHPYNGPHSHGGVSALRDEATSERPSIQDAGGEGYSAGMAYRDVATSEEKG